MLADGNDSPPECTALLESEDGGAGDEVTVTAPAGQVVNAICIKSGKDAIEGEKHSGLITTDATIDDCYIVDGLGTAEVTVTRVDNEGCKEISHVDFGTGTPATATTTTPTTAAGTTAATVAGNVLGGNPTTAPLPNTAIGVQTVSTAALLGLLLIVSLGAMAYMRVSSRR